MKLKRILGCLVLLAFAGTARSQAADSLHPAEPLWTIADFTLTDRHGEPFSSEQLRGKIWVAHFFFTTCIECNQHKPTMQELQKRLRGRPGVRLVSISVNADSPENLDRFAADLGADPDQWIFLTGDKKKVHAFVTESFKRSVIDNPSAEPGKEIGHEFFLEVVDEKGRVRGWADGKDRASAEAIDGRLRSLSRMRMLFPTINAILNFQCAVLLILGYAAIKQRRETLHKVAMLSALVVSAVFLASYLYYHFVIQLQQPLGADGWPRVVYFIILISHIVLAVVATPLALVVAYQGLRDRRPRHVRLARWTLPIWLYVSVTGVVVYLMLYHFYPAF